MHLRSRHVWRLLLSLRVRQPGWNVVRWLKCSLNFMNFITFLARARLPKPSSGLGNLSVHVVLRHLCQRFWSLLHLPGELFWWPETEMWTKKNEVSLISIPIFVRGPVVDRPQWTTPTLQGLNSAVNLIWCCLNSIIWLKSTNARMLNCSPTATMKTLLLARFLSARPMTTSVWWDSS